MQERFARLVFHGIPMRYLIFIRLMTTWSHQLWTCSWGYPTDARLRTRWPAVKLNDWAVRPPVQSWVPENQGSKTPESHSRWVVITAPNPLAPWLTKCFRIEHIWKCHLFHVEMFHCEANPYWRGWDYMFTCLSGHSLVSSSIWLVNSARTDPNGMTQSTSNDPLWYKHCKQHESQYITYCNLKLNWDIAISYAPPLNDIKYLKTMRIYIYILYRAKLCLFCLFCSICDRQNHLS